MKKGLKVFLLLLVASLTLTSCGFFESDPEGVKDIDFVENQEDNEIRVVVKYYDADGSEKEYTIPAGMDGKDGLGIKQITTTRDTDNARTILTIEYTDPERENEVIIVPDGTKIVGINNTYDPNTNNNYMHIEYSDGTQSDAILIPKGETGVGIDKDKTTWEVNEDGSTSVKIYYTDAVEPVEFDIPAGVGITAITSSLTGGTYNLEVEYSNGETETIEFFRSALWFEGTANPNTVHDYDEDAKVGDYFFDTMHKKIYRLEEEEWVLVVDFNSSDDKYTVEFLANDEGGVEATIVGNATVTGIKYGTYFATGEYGAIPTPVRAGYRFVGWCTSKTPSVTTGYFNDLTPVFSNLTLYAIWEEIE